MSDLNNYLSINRTSWNQRAEEHIASDFYNVPGFLAGNSTLTPVELPLLGDISGQRLLHLQCHFGLDTLSLARMGARVTGIDLSDTAIAQARLLTAKAGLEAEFVCCDVYSTTDHVAPPFDVIFSSYGTIGWLPDIERWAAVIARCLRPGGRFVFAEFHPVVWMFNEDFTQIAYRYFCDEPILESGSGTYTNRRAAIPPSICWNHGLGEVLGALLRNGLQLRFFEEYDYSPYNCLGAMSEVAPGRFRIRKLGDKMPLVYALIAEKTTRSS